MGCTTFVAELHGWDHMAERQREVENDGVYNFTEALGAENAVVTQVANWAGRGLMQGEQAAKKPFEGLDSRRWPRLKGRH